MNFLKKAGIVCGNILLVGSLLFVAFLMPEWIAKMKDESSLGQEKSQKLEMNAYEVTYRNFAEKLYFIASNLAFGIEMQVVQMPDSEVPDEELTEYVTREADSLLTSLWETSFSVKPEGLRERKLYMLYSSKPGETGNAFAGIYFYKLTYVMEVFGYDNMELTFLLDSEFHKLYGFAINTLKSNASPEEPGELNPRLLRVKEEGLAQALSLDKLIDYWELEENYGVEEIKEGNEQFWKGEKYGWGRFSCDYLYLYENRSAYSCPLTISRYVLYQEDEVFVAKMGLLLLDEFAASMVEYDSDYKKETNKMQN